MCGGGGGGVSTCRWVGGWWVSVCVSAMVQVGLWVPTPFAERRSQASCEFLAGLQEFALHWPSMPA